MSTIKKMFGKVADLAKKVVLVGAIVGGVSLVANATETTAGPTIEKAQLETVNVNLKAVVDAITKVDSDWVKGLPRVRSVKAKKKLATTYFLYEESDHSATNLRDIGNWENLGEDPDVVSCNEPSGIVCLVAFEGDESAFQTYLATATYSQMVADGIIEAHKL